MHKLISIIVLVFILLTPNQAAAQSLPTNSPPIQRIIEEEGAQTFSTPSVETRESNTGAVYGLLATGLVLIAAGAGYLLWVGSRTNPE